MLRLHLHDPQVLLASLMVDTAPTMTLHIDPAVPSVLLILVIEIFVLSKKNLWMRHLTQMQLMNTLMMMILCLS